MTAGLGARTRLVALLGDPVHHSLSPRFQNAAFRAAGLDAVYLALRCDAHSLAGLIRAIAAAGGAGNVTVPHKQRAADAVDLRTEAADRTGACNAFWVEDGRLVGDNTDVVGIRRALDDLRGDWRGARALLVGAGGAASAALCALVDGGADVTVTNRSTGRAEALAARFARAAAQVDSAYLDRVEAAAFDLVVNATSLGLAADDPLPLDPDRIRPTAAALDLVYSPARTPWVLALRERGIIADDGLGVLLYQGAAAFERWWGIPAPLDVMRDALPTRATGERHGPPPSSR
jgi:shikimate dehydrogenase